MIVVLECSFCSTNVGVHVLDAKGTEINNIC